MRTLDGASDFRQVASAASDTALEPAPEADRPARIALTGVRRYQVVCVAAVLSACVPYLWVLWDLWSGRVDPLRVNGRDHNPIYDVQARALMHGHLWIPNRSIGAEAFVVNGHSYTYFGIFPSLLRVPIFLFTSSLDGRLVGPSMLGAWIVTAVFCSLLLWRLRVYLRGDPPLGWLEATSYGVLLASILAGSVLIFLASAPDAFNEDEAWSIALAFGSFFALLGVIERPSWRRITLCGLLVLLTNLNRATTGYAVILATLLVAAWFALGRAGEARRHWALALACAGLVPLLIGCVIDLARFGVLFGVPFSSQLVFKDFRLQAINGGNYFSLHWLPDTLKAYLSPANFHFSSVFPYVFLPPTPTGGLFDGSPTASVPLSMPLLFISGLWGVVTTFRPGRSVEFRGLRFLLIAAAATAASLLVFGWIFERFVGDFVPLLVIAGMIGLIDVWGRTRPRPRTGGVLVLVFASLLAVFGFWANMGFALTPNTDWSETQLTNYLNVQRAFSDVTGHPLNHLVVVGKHPPDNAPVGTLYATPRCGALYVAWQTVSPNGVPPSARSFVQVEAAPHTPVCHALIGNH